MCADALRHRIRHRPVPEGADQAPLPVHREITRGPHGRQADVAREDGVLRRVVADRLGDLLGMNEPLAGLAHGEFVEPLAGFGVMLPRVNEMRVVALWLE